MRPLLKSIAKKYWLFDCIDAKTCFLLASHLSPNRGTREARTLMEKTAERADKTPKVMLTDKLAAYLDSIELAFGADAEHKQGSPFDVRSNTSLIKRFQGIRQTFYDRVGLRIFQQEAVTIQKWVFSEPHQWIIGKFQAGDFHLHQMDIVCKLLQMALILAHYLHFGVEKNHS